MIRKYVSYCDILVQWKDPPIGSNHQETPAYPALFIAGRCGMTWSRISLAFTRQRSSAWPVDRVCISPRASAGVSLQVSAMAAYRDKPQSLVLSPALVMVLLLLVVGSVPAYAQWRELWDYFPPTSGASLSSQPLKRAAHSLVVHKDSLYVFGGIGDTGKVDDHEYDDTWRYDILNDKWVQIIGDREGSPNATGSGVISPPHRFHHSTALHTNESVAEMVVFGGLSIAQMQKGTGATASVDMVVTQFNDIWRLTLHPEGSEIWRMDSVANSTATNATSSGSSAISATMSLPSPAARSEAGAVAHDGQLYIFGGIAYDEVVDASPKDFDDLWQYDLSTCKWTQLKPTDDVTPPARFSHSMTKFTTNTGETYLVVFSGRRLELPSWSLLSDTWVFSLTTLKWRLLQSSMPLQRAYTSVVATGGEQPKLWFFGGYFRPKQGSSGYVYDDVVGGYVEPGTNATPAGVQFYHAMLAPEDAVPPLRYNHRAVLWRDTMIIHGGSYQTQRGDVWQFNLTSAVMKQDMPTTLPVNMATLVYVLAGFVFSIVIVLAVLIIRWRRIDRRNMELARMRGVSATNGLTRERLDQMEIIKYKKPTPTDSGTAPTTPSPSALEGGDDSAQNNDDICPICLIEFEEDEDVRNLPCKHLFHVACIDEWLGRNTTCPMCKNNLDLDIVNVEIVPEPTNPPRSRQPSAASPLPSPGSSPLTAAQPQSRGGSIVTPVTTGPS